MNNRFYTLFAIIIGSIILGCSPEEQPGENGGFDVKLNIPTEITLDEGATSIDFSVIDGKAPKQTDILYLDGPAGHKSCKILSVSSEKISVGLYSGFVEGLHKVSIQRGLDILNLGTANITFKVFDDGVKPASGSSVYGKVSCDGKGLAGVVVSDGVEVVQTDENGVYQMTSQKKHGYVFVSIPSGYTVSTNVVFPQFYKFLKNSASVAERADFELTKVENPDEFTLLVFGDMHLANRDDNNDLPQFQTFLEDIKDFRNSHNGNLYGLTLGDMIWDKYWVTNSYSFEEYINEMKPLTGLPIFQTAGNHDHDLYASGDFDTMIKYKQHLGPSYYSHNIGKVHFVSLDDIDCANPGTGKNATYTNNLVQEQLDWLKKDLALVSKDTPLIVSLHAQLFANPGNGKTPEYAMNTSSAAALEDILDDFTTVHVYSGHTHKMYTVDNTLTKNGIFEHNASAVCACWWVPGVYHPQANITSDGVPGGYTVVRVNGKDITWQYKGTKFPITRQFFTYDRNTIDLDVNKLLPDLSGEDLTDWTNRTTDWSGPSTANEVYINVWNFDTQWKIEVTENGTPLPVTWVIAYDPLHMRVYAYERYRRNEAAGHLASKNWHTYKVKASSPTSTLEIKVTDRFGNVYTETMKRPKEFKPQNYYWSTFKD